VGWEKTVQLQQNTTTITDLTFRDTKKKFLPVSMCILLPSKQTVLYNFLSNSRLNTFVSLDIVATPGKWEKTMRLNVVVGSGPSWIYKRRAGGPFDWPSRGCGP
jgi:hypothetical protein